VQETSILAKLVYNSTFKEMTSEERNNKIDAIVGDVIIFFFAGTDTTSSTMAATFHLLHKNPKVLEKLIEELKKTPEDYSHSSIKSLKYMDAVFN
jgi:cytochrome P450